MSILSVFVVMLATSAVSLSTFVVIFSLKSIEYDLSEYYDERESVLNMKIS
ncbi:MAG: hypothetical protein JJT76_14780 [Clostridiaceae bacterium]|nr:hypothetical protein [Clostridiaceae bacterium]